LIKTFAIVVIFIYKSINKASAILSRVASIITRFLKNQITATLTANEAAHFVGAVYHTSLA